MSKSFLLIILLLVSMNPNATLNAEILNVPEDFETIMQGMNAAEEEDTVLVAPGEYEERIQYSGRNIVLASNYILEQDEDLIAATVIMGNGGNPTVTFHSNRGNPRGEIIGFTVTSGAPCIWISSSSPRISHCVISNGDYQTGGGMRCYPGSAEVDHCLFIGNTATYGGGVYVSGPNNNPTFNSCQFVDNRAREGAGLWCSFDAASIINCTFSGNIAESEGGAIFGSNRSEIVIENSILWSNQPQEIAISGDANESSVTVGYTDIEGGQDNIVEGEGVVDWLDGNINADPLFVDPDNGDYHLTLDSPCIDAGDPEAELDPDGTQADMGAFYLHQRDIAVEPMELHFPPIYWGEQSELPVEIRNEGKTPLHLLEIPIPMHVSAITPEIQGEFAPPIEIAPDSIFTLLVFYNPGPNIPLEDNIVIISDDPDEAEVIIFAEGTVNVPDDPIQPVQFSLSPPYPNPFNSSTTFTYSLPHASTVILKMYDLSGMMVSDVFGGRQLVGIHAVTVNGDNFASGLYFVRLDADGQVFTRKVMLVR